MLIIIPVVSLSVVGYTTVKATDINVNYILWCPELSLLCASDQPFLVYDAVKSSNVYHVISTEGTNCYYYLRFSSDIQSFIGGNLNTDYATKVNDCSFYDFGYGSASNKVNYKATLATSVIISNKYPTSIAQIISSNLSTLTIYTNSSWSDEMQALVKEYNNDLTDVIGESMTTEQILNIVNQSINSTTQTYNNATSIYNTLQVNYASYQAGDIDKATMQGYITQAIDSLNELNEIEGNTLADLIAINNALTYAQTVQQELLLIPSSSVTSSVQTILQAVSNLVQQYQNGSVTQAQAMQELRGYAYQLSQLITSDISISDIEVINTGTNVVNNFIDILANNSDLDKNVSDKSQHSDDDELSFIETLETEQSIEDLAPSKIYIQGQTNSVDNSNSETITDLFNAVWNNAIIKILIPIFAGFSIIAVVFGRKYKL